MLAFDSNVRDSLEEQSKQSLSTISQSNLIIEALASYRFMMQWLLNEKLLHVSLLLSLICASVFIFCKIRAHKFSLVLPLH